METIDKTDAAQAVEAPKVSRFARLRNRVAGAFVTGAVLISVPVAAQASPLATVDDPLTDPTGGAGDTFFTSLTAYLQGHLIAAVLALAVIGVSVSMLIAWGKKAAKSK